MFDLTLFLNGIILKGHLGILYLLYKKNLQCEYLLEKMSAKIVK